MVSFCLGFVPTLQIGTNVLCSGVARGFPGGRTGRPKWGKWWRKFEENERTYRKMRKDWGNVLISPTCEWEAGYCPGVVGHVSTSQLDPVLSGVPQGSVLGPLLFLTSINNLCHIPFSSGSKLVLYADDTTLYKPINSKHDFGAFQEDINKIYEWFTLQTSCRPMLRKPKPWSYLQNLTNIRTFSFPSTTMLLRELTTSRSLVLVSMLSTLSTRP